MLKIKKKEVSISEQMERTSVNIFTFSTLNKTTDILHNFPIILGGEDIIEDEVAKLKVEESFGQLNIQSLFGHETHVLNSVLYTTLSTGGGSKRLTPQIYLLKSYSNDVFMLNFLSTPYSDLNVASYFTEVEFMSKALSGVFQRTNVEIETNISDEQEQFEKCKETVNNLVGFLHYQIFKERGLRSGKEDVHLQLNMILGLFLEFKIDKSELQCIGTCGQTFVQDDAQFEKPLSLKDLCPQCEGTFVQAPPFLKSQTLQFIYPPEGVEFLNEFGKKELDPSKYLNYFSSIVIQRSLSLTVNRLAPSYFGELLPFPLKASFTGGKHSKVQVNTNHFVKDEKAYFFVSISDSRFTGKKYQGIYFPALSTITLNRDLAEGFNKGLTLNRIVKNSIINNWVISKPIEHDAIGEYTSFADIPLSEA